MKRLLLLPLAVATAFATGDYYEESVPSLPVFLGYDRLPRKTLLDIVRETQPAAPKDKTDFEKELTAIAAAIQTGKAPHDYLPKVEVLLVAERQRAVRNDGHNNSLHDLRDLCAASPDAAAATEYLDWRLTDDKAVPDPDEAKARAAAEARVADLKKRFDAAPPAIKPHYLYAQAAAVFWSGDDAASQKLFEKIVADFPDHPRAEVARYMAARCISRQSHATNNDGTEKYDEAKVAAARKAYEDYLKKYPQGSYVGDVYGWLGGLEFNAGKPAAALPWFVKQLALPGHPELAVSATKDIEFCFRALHDEPGALAGALTDPRVAQAAVYFASNEIEPVDNNGEYESTEFVAAWRKALFPAIAAALSGHPEVFSAPGWKPRYVAALALAASGAGDQAQALKVLEGADAASDDVAFARAVVLQRAKRFGEAAGAYRAFIQKYPKSPLTPALHLRLALTLLDDHRAGDAALILMKLEEKEKTPAPPSNAPLPKEAGKEDEKAADVGEGEETDQETEDLNTQRILSGVAPAEPAQVRQLLDTIFNFAPLPELAAIANDAKAPEEFRTFLRHVVAVRHLARERFPEAKPFMTPAQWDLVAGPLAQLTAAAQAAKTPAEKAATAMKLANAWAAARGKLLTVPVDTEEWRREVFADDHPATNFRRVENGPAVGLNGASALDLENRDELRHAFNWWIIASDAQPRTPDAAKAVWRALRAMPDIATVSPFTLDRANAKKWQDTSRKLCERLEQEHAGSPEARLAVWWTFPPGKDDDGKFIHREEYSDAPPKEEPEQDELKPNEVESHLKAMTHARGGTIAQMRKEAAAGFKWARARLLALDSQDTVNFFEDLNTFFATPDLTPEIGKRYLELRYYFLTGQRIDDGLDELRPKGKEPEPGTVRGTDQFSDELNATVADPRFAKVADFLAFLQLAVTATERTSIPLSGILQSKDKNGDDPVFWGHDYIAMEEACRAWLEKYPKSAKREAALLLHCRAIRGGMMPCVLPYFRRASWPQAPWWEGAGLSERVVRVKFDAKVWKGALDRYDKEFPKGAYADDVLGYRADLAVRLKDWKRALQITVAQLDGKPHLLVNARARRYWIFSFLASDADRPDLLAAIRATGGARAALQEELKAAEENGSQHPLSVLHDWLAEQAQQ
jgi:TolA-binding protein